MLRFGLAIAALIMVGCVPSIKFNASPKNFKITGRAYDVVVSPIGPYPTGTQPYYNGLNLTVRNKTSHDLIIDWDKTLYLNGGQTDGRFMFPGIKYKDCSAPKASDVVFAGRSFSKNIYPCVLVKFERGYSNATWVNGVLREGSHGVYLTLRANDSELKERLTINVVALED